MIAMAATSPPLRTKSPIEISSGSRISRIRSSNPSYRPHSSRIRWRSANCSTVGWSSRRPCGVSMTRWPGSGLRCAPPRRTRRPARPSAPCRARRRRADRRPTCVCPSAQSRMLCSRTSTRPRSIARFNRLWPRYPWKISGNRVKTSNRMAGRQLVCSAAGASRLRFAGSLLGRLGGVLDRLLAAASAGFGAGHRRQRPADGGSGPAGPGPACCAARCVPSGAVLLDQHPHLVRRLGADAQPVVDPLAVEHGPGVGLGDHRVVGAQLLQHPAVARPARCPSRKCDRTGRCFRPNFFIRIRTATRFSS